MPSRTAFLFPGQGRIPDSLPANMGQIRPLLDHAHAAGLLLENWIAAGNSDRLMQTDASQPLLLIDSLFKDAQLREAGYSPTCVAGHSLGEYAALVSAGVLSAIDAMDAVIERGRLMRDVRGSMAAILKLDVDAVSALCDGTDAVVANHNAITQVVISGPDKAVQDVLERAAAAGGKAIALNVSGPFHSPLMSPAQTALSPLLESLAFNHPSIPIISGVSGQAVSDAQELRTLLVQQMTASVRWVHVAQELDRLEVDTAIEVGSGDVLTRLGRRSTSSIRFLTFEEAIHEGI